MWLFVTRVGLTENIWVRQLTLASISLLPVLLFHGNVGFTNMLEQKSVFSFSHSK